MGDVIPFKLRPKLKVPIPADAWFSYVVFDSASKNLLTDPGVAMIVFYDRDDPTPPNDAA